MIKVFEAFSGYGSQRMALKNIGIDHEVVGISEIDGDVLLSYAAIHEDLLNKRTTNLSLNEETMLSYLESLNVPLNYRTFENRAKSLKGQKLIDMYLANILSKNYGDIRNIDPNSLPDFDFFTYSFPCQDISVAGYQNGLVANSGTRSSLLWDCCKIIKCKKPKYLMMENVKNLVGKNHINNFNDFLSYLEKLGYSNFWSILNARDFGIPQNRERVFCISILNCDTPFLFPETIKMTKSINDFLENDVPEKYFLKDNEFTDSPINQDYIYCLDSNYWKGTFLKDFLEKRRRQLVSGKAREDGKYPARRLTPLETWRFMGCKDEDYFKAKSLVSNTSLYKQSGNSIVIPVMEAIFRNLFKFNKLEEIKMNKQKQTIIELFRSKVKGKTPDVSGLNEKHDGRKGHWLEQQFGIAANATNGADILGYELKNETTSKTTFGDWSANRYIFKDGEYTNLFKGNTMPEKQDDFCRIFGKANEDKNGRCSWSGSPCPKINQYNEFGQTLLVERTLDIIALYSFSKDMRVNKHEIVPQQLQKDNLVIARWFGTTSPSNTQKDKCIKEKLEDKFNDCGWFTCKTDSTGKYQKICFGEPMIYENWIKLVSSGIVFFDSGMYQGNKRPYSQWRAQNKFWESLIVETHE